VSLVKYNNNSISAVTSASSIPSGALTHIKTLTASSSATLSFVDGSDGVVLDSTYPIYKFEFINIQPTTNDVIHQFNLSTDSGSNYNVTKTSTFFRAYHTESDSTSALAYASGDDLAQSTSYQNLDQNGLGNGSDESESGSLTLFNPSSTTFVKHFIATTQYYQSGNASYNAYIAGYGNTQNAVDAIQFKMSSGNMNGTIKLYGIKDS
jgi:hypothetical protein